MRFQIKCADFSSLRNAVLARWSPIAKSFFHAAWEACVADRPWLRCNKFLAGRSVYKFTIFLSKSNTVVTGRSTNAASSGFATRLACCTSASSHGRLRLMVWRHRGKQRRWNELRRITQVPGSVQFWVLLFSTAEAGNKYSQHFLPTGACISSLPWWRRAQILGPACTVCVIIRPRHSLVNPCHCIQEIFMLSTYTFC